MKKQCLHTNDERTGSLANIDHDGSCMNTHTPGPWKVTEVPSVDLWGKRSGQATVVDSAGNSIAIVGRNSVADARLIAAAPELLEALKASAQWLGFLIANNHHQKAVAPGHAERTLERVEALIAKVEGR